MDVLHFDEQSLKNNHEWIVDNIQSQNFLNQFSLKKSPISRLFSWLITFGAIEIGTPKQISQYIVLLYNDYCKKLHEFKTNDPFEFNRKDEFIITADVSRSYHWFCNLANSVGLDFINDENDPRNVRKNIERILAQISMISNEYSYIQGYDRYAFISFLVSFMFAKQVQIQNPSLFAEAMAFYLTKGFLQIVNVSDILRDSKKTQERFEQVDQLIKEFLPQIHKEFQNYQINSILFALKWQILWFADEHNLQSILLIWDLILAHKSSYHDYFNSLILAHLAQIKRIPDQALIETIQNYKHWNTLLIVNQADKIYRRRYNKSMFMGPRAFVIIFLILLIIIMVVCSLYFREDVSMQKVESELDPSIESDLENENL